MALFKKLDGATIYLKLKNKLNTMVDLQGKTPDQAYTALAQEIAKQLKENPKAHEVTFWQNTAKELLRLNYRMGYQIGMIITAINEPERLTRQPSTQPKGGQRPTMPESKGENTKGDIASAMKQAKLKALKK